MWIGTWIVLTGETTVRILQDNGIDLNQCDDSGCHLQTARQMAIDKFLSQEPCSLLKGFSPRRFG